MASSVPRTQVHSSDLSSDDFGLIAGKIVSTTGLAGPVQLTEGTIDDYDNTSGKGEVVWYGGTQEEPGCVWIVFANNQYVKIKWPSPSEEGFCQAVVDCAIADLAKGGGTDDKYLVPELAGPTWQLLSVIYGEDDTEVDFSDVIEDDLIALVGALNDHDDLPDGWLWSISSSVLVLSVPHDTDVSQISIAGGFEIDFTAPSVIGTPASQLAAPMAESLAGPMDVVIAQYEAMLETYAGVLANAFGVGTATTEVGIETEFTANSKIEVRWTDADGDARISYKDPVNGWYHPITKAINVLQVYTNGTPGVGASTWDVDNDSIVIDVTTGAVPADARFVDVRVDLLVAAATTGTGTSSINGTIIGRNTGAVMSFDLRATGTELGASGSKTKEINARVPVKANGTIVLDLDANSVVNHIVSIFIHVTAWER